MLKSEEMKKISSKLVFGYIMQQPISADIQKFPYSRFLWCRKEHVLASSFQPG